MRMMSLWVAGSWLALAMVAPGQNGTADPDPAPSDGPAAEVKVQPVARDEEIAERLSRILDATDWFEDVEVVVDEGVVFLIGGADTQPHKEWAGRLAGQTQDVVAVVNRMVVAEPAVWDLSPAWKKLKSLTGDVVRALPLIGVGVILVLITLMAMKWTRRGASAMLARRFRSGLLRHVAARTLAVLVFLIGLYVVLKVSGLTGLAATVIGGTGLIGLALGFAFRDIAENFLASVLLSMQQPFATGDLIEVTGHKGFVQRVNTRSTLLMTLEGNHVQIPNATVYKETIVNFTANPHARFDFAVGIGYEDSIAEAQSAALEVLRSHEAVVTDPEPLVLAESLGAATVNLRVYFWTDIGVHSGLKVRSAMIRLVKRAFEAAGISMSDEPREIIFPAGVPVRILSEGDGAEEQQARAMKPAEGLPEEPAAHQAEGDLASEAGEIQEQARKARNPEGGENLLEGG